MSSLISMLLPDSALPLVLILSGLALMLGLVDRRALASRLLGFVIVPVLAAPFVEGVLGSLPAWVSVVVLVFLAAAILRALTGFLLGRGAADHLVGSLSADVVRFLLSLVFLPFQILVRLWSRRGSSRT